MTAEQAYQERVMPLSWHYVMARWFWPEGPERGLMLLARAFEDEENQ